MKSMITIHFKNVSLALALSFASSLALSQSVATVNGVNISDTVFQQNLKSVLSQGQKDTPELRLALKEELVNREVLAQESAKLGLDKTPEAKAQWSQIRENFLVDLLLVDYSNKNPITDAAVKAEYEKQVAVLGGANSAQQYKLSVIVVPSATEANDVLAKLKKGDSFEKLAKDKSIDQTKAQGGLVGWVLPSQVSPVLSAVMVNLAKGAYSATAIQGPGGWTIIKVDEKRAFKVPGFDESKDRIRASLVQQQRLELLKKLRSESKVTIND